MEDVGITRTVARNLIIEGRAPEPITVAEISSSAFRVAGVSALRGRYLMPEDEAPGAADAMVIGYDEWVRRFGPIRTSSDARAARRGDAPASSA